MAEWPGADYNGLVQRARLLVTGPSGLTADTVALWDQLLAATIEAIAADLGAGKITPERAEQLKRAIGHHLGRLNVAYDGVLSGAAEATGATVATAHAQALSAAGAAAGATLTASFAEVPKDVLAYSLARRQAGGSQQLKGLASRGLSHLAGDVDDILFKGMARGISSRRLAEELGAAMAAGDPDVLAAVKDPKLRRALKAANPDDPVYKAAQDLRRYGRMVAVSEINEAHRSAQVLSAIRSPVVGTLTWTRSGRHAGLKSSPCECDVLATQDAYKLGPGVYPKHAYPAAPHPHCACFPTMNPRPPGEWGTPIPYPDDPPLPVPEREVKKLFTRLGGKPPTPAKVKRTVAGVGGNVRLAFTVGQQGHAKVLAAAEKTAAKTAASLARKEAPLLKTASALSAEIAASAGNVAGLKALVDKAKKLLADAEAGGLPNAKRKAQQRLKEAEEALAAKQLANKKAAKKHAAKKKLAEAEELAAAGDLEAAKKKAAGALEDAAFAGADDFVAAAQKTLDDLEAALTKPKLDAAGFPLDADGLGTLEFVQNLGGSTGAKLYRHPDTGKLFVRKQGANAGHLLEETYADAAYRAAGADVPDFRVYTVDGKPVKLSAFLPDDARSLKAVLASSDEALKAQTTAQLREGFALDALLGNWDVVGLELDNVMVAGGKVYRIDNGGSLRYRAMGAKKTAAQWNATVGEIATLRDPKMNPSAAKVFAGLTDEQVAAQIDALALKRKAILEALPEELRATVAARLDNMEAWAAGVKAKAKQAAEAQTKAQAAAKLALENPGNVAVLKDAVEAATEAVAAAQAAGDASLVATAKKALQVAEETLEAKQLANKKSSKKYAAKTKLSQAEKLLEEPTAAGVVPVDESTLQKAVEKLESALEDAKFAGAADVQKAVQSKLDEAKAALSAGSAQAQAVVKKAAALSDLVDEASGNVAKLKQLIADAEKLGVDADAIGNPSALSAAQDALKKAQDALSAKQLANKVSSKKYALKKALDEAEELLAAGQAAKAKAKLQSAGKNLDFLKGHLPAAELKALEGEISGKLTSAVGQAPAKVAAKKAPKATAKKALAAADDASDAKTGPPKPKSPSAAEAKAIAAAEEQLGWAKKGTTDYWLGQTVQKATAVLNQPGVQASPYAKHVAQQALDLAKGKKAALAGTAQGVSAEALENLAEALLDKAKTATNPTYLTDNAHYAQTALGVAKKQKAPKAVLQKLEEAASLSQQNKQKLQAQVAPSYTSSTPGTSKIGAKAGPTKSVTPYDNYDLDVPGHIGTFKHFEDRSKAHDYGKREWKDWGQKVTQRQVSGIKSYKGSGYSSMNRFLRGKTSNVGDTYRRHIRAIDEALAFPEGRLKEDTMLYRGLEKAEWWNPGTDLVGQTIDDQAFMSTAFSRYFAHRWAQTRSTPYKILMEIRAPKGTPGGYLEARPDMPINGEFEFLLARGAHFKVTGVRTEMVGGSEIRIIECDLLGFKTKVDV